MSLNEGRAAQYVRMSTDMQQHSILNQSAAIARYAAQRGLTIVRSYEDVGRSGLRLEGRDALRSLIGDVQSGRADFTTILVYDVSRWGRFQDADESAHYEFICKEAGVSIEYCAEQFDNDGSLAANIIKNIKRAMAGEFSRELSVKVFAGQSRNVSKGFFVGSTPGYGLRRVLLDEHGNPKMELAAGQRKNITTEHTILAPGPPHEIRIVHQVYDLFIDKKESMREIARILNARGIPNVAGLHWNPVAIRQLLSNEKYIGTSVYNRTSRKLHTRSRRNPPAQWVRAAGAFEPVVPLQRFQEAQRQIEENARPYSDNEMLDFLTATWCRQGRLNAFIVDSSKNAPRVNAYRKHFGSLVSAYLKIGYAGQFNAGKNLGLRKAIVRSISARVRRLGGTISQTGGSCQILINNELAIAVVAAHAVPSCGRNQWRMDYRSHWKPDIVVVARIDADSSAIRDYFLVPFVFLPNGRWLTARELRYQRLDAFRSETLDPLYRLCARKTLFEV
jgi:DNA invertase Pin-like site-specific DNA recombinase